MTPGRAEPERELPGGPQPPPDAAGDRGRARGEGLEPLLADAAHDPLAEVGGHALPELRAQGVHATLERGGVRAFGRPTDYNNRVLVLLNGLRVNDSIFDGALIGTEFPLDISLVER